MMRNLQCVAVSDRRRHITKQWVCCHPAAACVDQEVNIPEPFAAVQKRKGGGR